MEKKFKWNVEQITDGIKDLLIAKNIKYGNAALDPLKIFSSEDSSNSIAIRLDDKINRIKNSNEPRKNDVVDLMGYLILYMISRGWTNFKELYE